MVFPWFLHVLSMLFSTFGTLGSRLRGRFHLRLHEVLDALQRRLLAVEVEDHRHQTLLRGSRQEQQLVQEGLAAMEGLGLTAAPPEIRSGTSTRNAREAKGESRSLGFISSQFRAQRSFQNMVIYLILS